MRADFCQTLLAAFYEFLKYDLYTGLKWDWHYDSDEEELTPRT